MSVKLIRKIARRATQLRAAVGVENDTKSTEMDIAAVHTRICKLRLQELLDADDFNFCHDVFGIERHLNRKKIELTDCFRPRFGAH